MTDNQRFTVAVIDDDESFREAALWLAASRGYSTTGYADESTFLRGHPLDAVGCALMDLRLGERSGLDAFLQARDQGFDMPVIMISAYGDIATAVRAVHMGAFSWIEKPIRNEKLIKAIEAACAAHDDICRRYGRAANYVRNFSMLTQRELEIYWHLCKGLTAKEIASELAISHRTVETHRNQISAKLCIRSIRDFSSAAYHTRFFAPNAAASVSDT
ncbi:response regulator transcription factor [Magnetospirillum sp. SS-4]|uniref:response regulator transcription factor n=1 Tax=Magnetospirillum sp. SS-4 TaxID=2681465 RepID=UPI00138517BA|nr:response regulator [Magnetospirillum sp. SS-4]CAA7614269.1 LuxR family transcriptional regulator [Magnetospirillum sp. SS-4]